MFSGYASFFWFCCGVCGFVFWVVFLVWGWFWVVFGVGGGFFWVFCGWFLSCLCWVCFCSGLLLLMCGGLGWAGRSGGMLMFLGSCC